MKKLILLELLCVFTCNGQVLLSSEQVNEQDDNYCFDGLQYKEVDNEQNNINNDKIKTTKCLFSCIKKLYSI